jgi:cell division protease FtsH
VIADESVGNFRVPAARSGAECSNGVKSAKDRFPGGSAGLRKLGNHNADHASMLGMWLTRFCAGPYIPSDDLIPVAPPRPAALLTMSNSDSPPPAAPPPSGSNSDSPKRPEKSPSSGNLFWYLMLGLVLAALATSFLGRPRNPTTISFSEFLDGLKPDPTKPEGPRFSKSNVHELTFERGYFTFQSQSVEKDTADPKATKHYLVFTSNLWESDEKRLTDSLEAAGISRSSSKLSSMWLEVIPYMLFMVVFLAFLLFMLRRIGGPGAAMSFSRSRGKLFAQEDVKVTFTDVAGIDEAVEELKEVVEFLKTPQKYQALGGRIPRGVLLVGPPGTGKTLLAKAVAGEAGVPFFSLSGSDFVEMFVGVGAARVRDMFQQAAARSPAIIFIDELDALGKVRGSGMPGGHDERDQTLNALLVEMDGFGSDQSVIVMAATNRPETLDPALLRPGRFDRHVLVDRPDIRGREAILKVHMKKVKVDDSVDIGRLARISPGFVGADLANLVNEAALLAAREDKKFVTMHEFEEGIDRVVAGLEKQTRIIPEEEKIRVAYHECGHALVACSLPHTDPVHKISIIPRGLGALGYTMHRPEKDQSLVTQSELHHRICVLLGGIAAEQIVYKETSTGAQNDLQRATDIARRMVTEFGMSQKLGRVYYSEARRSPFLGTSTTADAVHSEDTVREIDLEVRRLIDESSKIALDILNERREVLEHMTKDLLDVEVMDAEHLKRILDEHKKGPQLVPGTSAQSVVEPTPESNSSALREAAGA